jgi:allantoinase
VTSDEFFVRSRRVVTPDGVRPAAVHVRDGRIAALQSYDGAADLACEDEGDLVVMAGIVDTHVHVNEPGRTEWEGFESATRAAAAGGVTTIVDMPLNSVPPTTTRTAFEEKLASAEGKRFVDVGCWGGVVPGNAAEVAPLSKAGVLGFKCFLVPSGVDEFPAVDEADLRAVLPEIARAGTVLLVHAEDPASIAAMAGAPTDYTAFMRSRPARAEHVAIERVAWLAREADARVHIVHVSSAGSLPILEAARASGVAITAETCPHYLTFAADDIPPGATEFKCAPPIRTADDRDALWAGLARGALDLIATDHSPAPPALKRRDLGDFAGAWGGIASLQLSLPIVWTAARQRGFPIEAVSRWLSAAPARLAGLHDRKGALAPGLDADFVVWDPDALFVVDPAALYHRHPLTPYAGRRLAGVVRRTVLGGRTIYNCGRVAASARGRALGGRGPSIRRQAGCHA